MRAAVVGIVAPDYRDFVIHLGKVATGAEVRAPAGATPPSATPPASCSSSPDGGVPGARFDIGIGG